MSLDGFTDETDGSTGRTNEAPQPPKPSGSVGAVLETTIERTFDDLDQDETTSFNYQADQVVCDKQELIEHVMMMAAMTAHEVNN